MRDPDTGNSKGYAFINFASFEASDAAIESMNGQYLCNRPISISYAFKKESKGERHGTPAGRFIIFQLWFWINFYDVFCNRYNFKTARFFMQENGNNLMYN